MRTTLLALALVAACDNNFSGPAVYVEYDGEPCDGDNVTAELVELRDGETVVDQRGPQACDPAPIEVTDDVDTLEVGALNKNGTFCWRTVDTSEAWEETDEYTLDVEATEPDCAVSATCVEHVDAMDPLYQLGLELKGGSLAYCDSLTAIEVLQILLSNEAATKGPAGNHLEGIQSLADRFLWTGATHEDNQLIFGPLEPTFEPTLATFGNDHLYLRPVPGFAQLPAPVVPPPGEYFAFAQVLKGDVPRADPTNFYQYAFVFDADGDTSNNYVPSPSYPSDFFKGTDRWYEVLYTPTGGWTKKVSTAHGSSVQVVQSAAQIVIIGAVIFLLVPTSEFAVPNPSYRLTAFRHTGDYGLGPTHDFDGYVEPPVAMGLKAFPSL